MALIYGAAGTAKSTMVNYISHYFNDANKLYLAQANPAVDKLAASGDRRQRHLQHDQ